MLSGAVATSLLALPAGALQFSIFRLAKRTGRELCPSWVSMTSVELVAGQFRLLCLFMIDEPLHSHVAFEAFPLTRLLVHRIQLRLPLS